MVLVVVAAARNAGAGKKKTELWWLHLMQEAAEG